MLRIEALSHRYPGAPIDALQDVSLSAARGSVLGLLGPNGAGKTTLISLLAGTLVPQRGRLLIDGVPLAQVRAGAPTRIAVAPQDHAFYGALGVEENLDCFAAAARLKGPRRRARIRDCMDFAQLARFASSRADRLSGGLKRRLNLAIALLAEPELLILDEPTAGVDPQSRAFILEAIARLARAGTAVVYTSHYMEEIEAIADRALILDRGQVLCQGSLSELLAHGRDVLCLAAPGLAQEDLLPFGSVQAPIAGGLWTVQLAPDHTPAAVLAALESRGLGVTQATYGRYSIEPLFMTLTRRPLRNAA